jgi:hypothetical protein
VQIGDDDGTKFDLFIHATNMQHVHYLTVRGL